jgi:inner membrane protein
MPTRLALLHGSVALKVLFIGALTLLLLIPMGMIEGVIDERMGLYAEARDNVANAWGEAQTIGGPILVVPFQCTQLTDRVPVTVMEELYVLAEELEIAAFSCCSHLRVVG